MKLRENSTSDSTNERHEISDLDFSQTTDHAINGLIHRVFGV
jgi:hypothetical protein